MGCKKSDPRIYAFDLKGVIMILMKEYDDFPNAKPNGCPVCDGQIYFYAQSVKTDKDQIFVCVSCHPPNYEFLPCAIPWQNRHKKKYIKHPTPISFLSMEPDYPYSLDEIDLPF